MKLIALLALIVCNFATFSVAELDWWESGNFYQIYPRSFKDSNGDGIGDLNGITQKVRYLKDIDVQGVWLSPIFKSPMVDFGYDISDYKSIQPEYGTMADFERLAQKLRELGIKLILDFVPNHTSDKHEWFEKSARREPGYENFYIWHPGKVDNVTGKRTVPNNWLSVFRFSAWDWNDVRKEYYLHQFAKGQPDLNYRDPGVVENMKEVLRFWLRKGVSGFRIDTIPNLFEINADKNGNYLDEPLSGNCKDDPLSHCYLKHIYTADQNETYDMAYQWHEVLEKFKQDNGGETRILMTEAYTSLENIHRYYGDGHRNGSQIPFNFEFLTNIKKDTSAKTIKEVIDRWLNTMPKGVHANWVLGNHDNKRFGTRLGESRIDLYNILLKTLPGICVTYNGEEIGMTDPIISWEESVDPQACNTDPTKFDSVSRDTARTPFQWDIRRNAGFSTARKTWLPVNINYICKNVLIEQTVPKSHLKVYKRLNRLRREPRLLYGKYEPVLVGDNILTFKRQHNNEPPVIVVLNLGEKWQTINLKQIFNVTDHLRVITASIQSQYSEHDRVSSTNLTIPNDVAIVLIPEPKHYIEDEAEDKTYDDASTLFSQSYTEGA